MVSGRSYHIHIRISHGSINFANARLGTSVQVFTFFLDNLKDSLFALPPDEELQESDAVLVLERLVDLVSDLVGHAVLVPLAQISPEEVAEGSVRLVARRAAGRQLFQHES